MLETKRRAQTGRPGYVVVEPTEIRQPDARQRDDTDAGLIPILTLVTTWLVYAFGATLVLYLIVVLALVLAGRRTDARALAGFVPDCVILFSRLLRDPRVPRRSKVFVALLLPYLALPIDVIPDFIPVAGQADDAILVGLVLRRLVRRTEAEILREHWPGPESSLAIIFKLSGAR